MSAGAAATYSRVMLGYAAAKSASTSLSVLMAASQPQTVSFPVRDGSGEIGGSVASGGALGDSAAGAGEDEAAGPEALGGDVPPQAVMLSRAASPSTRIRREPVMFRLLRDTRTATGDQPSLSYRDDDPGYPASCNRMRHIVCCQSKPA